MYYKLSSLVSPEIIISWEDTFLTFSNSLPKSTPPSHLVSAFSLSTCDKFIRKNKNSFYPASLSVHLLLILPLIYDSGVEESLSFGLWFGLFHVYSVPYSFFFFNFNEAFGG